MYRRTAVVAESPRYLLLHQALRPRFRSQRGADQNRSGGSNGAGMLTRFRNQRARQRVPERFSVVL